MKKQVVEINGKYAARVKRYKWTRWRYLGLNYKHSDLYNIEKFCLTNTVEEANKRFEWFGYEDFKVVLEAK